MPVASKGIPIPDSIEVAAHYLHEGIGYLEVQIVDYDSVKALPAGLSFEGRQYGKAAWNSDRFVAYYRTDKNFATKA
jgi:hypothetical protein